MEKRRDVFNIDTKLGSALGALLFRERGEGLGLGSLGFWNDDDDDDGKKV